MNWILASGSPRRRELLEMLGVPNLTIRPAKGPERATPGAGPEQTVRELALHKAQEIARKGREWTQNNKTVVSAGGLHILGTERHEARRIDNQLRGRSGRQGDPGSSRFYLSL